MEDDFSTSRGCSTSTSFLQRLSCLFSRTSSTAPPPPVDPLVLQTEILAADAVSFTVAGHTSCRSGHAFFTLSSHASCRSTGDNIQTCLRRCVLRMLDRHSITFGGMINKLNIDENVDFHEGFREVAEELFRDEVTWSKIVALFAFGARVAQHCSNNQMEALVADVADCLAEFAVEKLTPFIREQGGWVRLCEIFPEANDYERQLWQGLLVVGAGLGALATLLVLRQGLG